MDGSQARWGIDGAGRLSTVAITCQGQGHQAFCSSHKIWQAAQQNKAKGIEEAVFCARCTEAIQTDSFVLAHTRGACVQILTLLSTVFTQLPSNPVTCWLTGVMYFSLAVLEACCTGCGIFCRIALATSDVI